jgi:hypothetical protein
MSDMFLNQDELVILTGRKIKSKQIEALRRMGLPFHVNACGKPVVARVVIETRPRRRKPGSRQHASPDQPTQFCGRRSGLRNFAPSELAADFSADLFSQRTFAPTSHDAMR